MPRTLLAVASLATFAYVALCVLLFVAQRSLIYYPQPRGPAVPGTTALVLERDDGVRVEVTVRPARTGDAAPAVLYFGGNAEAVTYSLPELDAAFPTHALYLMHYRGYGGSGGRPSEAALVADAHALLDRVRVAQRGGDIVVVGRSLGSGVAVQLAAGRPRDIGRVVLVTPYDSLVALAARFYPVFPVRWLLRDRYDSARHAPQIDAPTLLIAAEHDEVIPREHAEALAARFRAGLATLRVVDGVGHNDISQSPEYMRLLRGPR